MLSDNFLEISDLSEAVTVSGNIIKALDLSFEIALERNKRNSSIKSVLNNLMRKQHNSIKKLSLRVCVTHLP